MAFHFTQSKTKILTIFCPLSLDLSELPIFHCSPCSRHTDFHGPVIKPLHLLLPLRIYSSSEYPHGLHTQLLPTSAQVSLFPWRLSWPAYFKLQYPVLTNSHCCFVFLHSTYHHLYVLLVSAFPPSFLSLLPTRTQAPLFILFSTVFSVRRTVPGT